MKFINTTIISLSIVISLVLPTRADFHIWKGTQTGGGSAVAACPSNQYNCNCFADGDSRVVVDTDDTTDTNYFQMEAGLCGMGKMNFYEQDDASWLFYVDGGDGTVQGQCYGNEANSDCKSGDLVLLIEDRLVCYSYICGN